MNGERFLKQSVNVEVQILKAMIKLSHPTDADPEVHVIQVISHNILDSVKVFIANMCSIRKQLLPHRA